MRHDLAMIGDSLGRIVTSRAKRPYTFKRHAAIGLQWVDDMRDKLDRRESSIGRWDELRPHSQELIRNLVNHLASVEG